MLLYPDWPAPAGVHAFSTLRSGGVSRGPYGSLDEGGLNLGDHVGDDPAAVAANRARLPISPVWLEQVHGVEVVDAAAASGRVPRADASFTTAPGVACAVLTADCLPVLFADVAGRIVGAAHAGWRGLAGGVLENTVAAMRAAGAAELLAWLGPAIGPQAFEVGAEVRAAFIAQDAAASAAFRATGAPGKYLADLYALARLRLHALGGIRVGGGQFCTVADPVRFYSYRRDKVTGRMAAVIWRD